MIKYVYGINILSHPIFFGQRARWNFGKFVVVLSTISTVSCSAERSLSILQRPKTEEKHLGIRLPQSSGTAMYWACLCQRSRYWKSVWWIFIRKSSFHVLFRIDFYTKQREWVILSLVKKVKLWILCFPKGILALFTSKKPQNFFWSHNKPLS